MIKVIEKGWTTFTKTCDRCGCKFQYDLSDLSGLDYINCPCCHTTLVHVGPKAIKIDLNKSNYIDLEEMRKNIVITPNKIDVGDGNYRYASGTGDYIDPNSTITISKPYNPKSDTISSPPNPKWTIHCNKPSILPDDIVDDPYNNIGSSLPDNIIPGNVSDNC